MPCVSNHGCACFTTSATTSCTAAAISAGDTNIERVAVEEKDADSSSLVFELRVRNREHLRPFDPERPDSFWTL